MYKGFKVFKYHMIVETQKKRIVSYVGLRSLPQAFFKNKKKKSHLQLANRVFGMSTDALINSLNQ